MRQLIIASLLLVGVIGGSAASAAHVESVETQKS